MLQEVRYGSDLYYRMTRLREEVLRRPLGLRQTAEDLEGEDRQVHIAAVEGEAVIGTVLLKPLTAHVVKVRQMAVAATARGRGLGTMLIRCAEEHATLRNFGEAELNARQDARGFYERLGYTPVGAPFLEVALPHIKMTRRIGRAAGTDL